MATLPPLGTPNEKLAEALKQLTAAKYGKPKASVEKDIFARLAPQLAPTTAAPFSSSAPPNGLAAPSGAPGGFGASPAAAAPAPVGASGGSFLDEWLAKRRTAPAIPPMTPSTVASQSQPLPATLNPPSAPPVATTFTPGSPAVPPSSQSVDSSIHLGTHRERVVAPPAASEPALDLSLLDDTALQRPPEPAEPAVIRPSQSAEPTPPSNPSSDTSKNISSDELEKQEVDRIAEELRQRLKQPKPLEAPAVEGDIIIDRDGTLHQTTSN